jgi:hypothetical protein
MRLLVRNARLLWAAAQIIGEQRRTIARLEAEITATELAYQRIGRDLIEQFLIALDKVEDHDVYRARLTAALGFYLDEIAVREEHA